MGHVRTKITVRNIYDVERLAVGEISADQVRQEEIEAIVDTGATSMCLPASVIERLNLRKVDKVEIRTANGRAMRNVYVAEIEVLGRRSPFQVTEVTDDCPALVGVIVLEAFDLVVDPTKEALTPNPAHGGKWTSYAY